MDWEEAAVAGRLRATIGIRLAGTAEELLMDDCFIWFSCSELTPRRAFSGRICQSLKDSLDG
jgi:hypothetical protein